MAIATRLTNTGSLLVNNSVDEASMAAGSISFNGTNQYLSIANNAAFDLSTGTPDWTIESWFYTTNSGVFQTIVQKDGTSGSRQSQYMLAVNASNQIQLVLSPATSSTGNQNFISTVTVTTNTWYHVAAIRSGSNITVYLNGVVVVGPTALTITMGNNTGPLTIGTNNPGASYFYGYLSNLRIVNGTAVYTGSFTPSQSMLPAITNTQLLLNVINSTNFITDSSSNAFTLTNNNTASFSANSPFGINTIGSIVFNGTSQYLSLPGSASSTAFNVGTGDWTIECWLNFSSVPAGEMDVWESQTTNTPRILKRNGSAGLSFDYYAGAMASQLFIADANIIVGTWYHIAVSRSAGTLKGFVNGVQVFSLADTITGATPSAVYTVGGRNGGANYLSGSITNFRFVNGTALYTSAGGFTPAGPLYPIKNTIFLLDATSSTNLVLDSGPYNFTVTNNNTATYAASRPSTGFLLPQQRVTSSGTMEVTDQLDEVTLAAGSLYFNGTNQYLSMASNTALNFSTGDFTVEAWVYPTSLAADFQIISSSGSGGFFLGYSSGFGFGWGRAAVAWDYRPTSGTANAWQHVAVTRSGTSMRIFVNGTQIGTTQTLATAYDLSTSSTTIGSQGAAYYLPGYISNLRVVTGTGVYTNPFTPPQSILPAIANTSLLLNMATSTSGTTDSSSNTFTVTNNNSVQWAGTSPYNQTNTVPPASTTPGSVLFNGTSQYLTVPSNAAFIFGTGDFTIEAWVYLAGGTSGTIFDNRTGISSTQPVFYFSSATVMAYYIAGTNFITSGSFTFLNNWVHVALCRASGSTRMFFNGVQTGSTYADTTNYTASGTVGVGASGWNAGNLLNGYITNLRVVKGTAVYTASFAPPTIPLTAISGTSLLLNATTSGTLTTDSSSNNFTVTNTGTATFSPLSPITFGSNPNGAGSVLFNGTTQYLSVASNAAFQFTGDFTVECWVYLQKVTGFQVIVGQYPSAGVFGWMLQMNNSSTMRAIFNNSTSTGAISASTAILVNTWYHVALTRSGTTVTLWFNGTSVGTSTLSGTVGTTTDAVWIANGGSTDFVQGYITNVRVVNGTALYTATFDVPTKPLTAVANTSLLVNTSAGGRIFDISSNGFGITNNATATYSNTVTPFPGVPALRQTNAGTLQASSEFDEVSLPAGAVAFSGSNYLNTPASSVLALGTSNFTIELWTYCTSLATNRFFGTNLNTTDSGFYMDITSGALNFGGWATTSVLTSGQTAVLLNKWTHIAWVRNSGVESVYFNGLSQISVTRSINFTSTGGLYIGAAGSGHLSSTFQGSISNFRLVNGTAVYTSNFTPPQSVLPAVTNTQLLLNVIDSTNFITDNSPNNFTLTNTGTATWTASGPFNS